MVIDRERAGNTKPQPHHALAFRSLLGEPTYGNWNGKDFAQLQLAVLFILEINKKKGSND